MVELLLTSTSDDVTALEHTVPIESSGTATADEIAAAKEAPLAQFAPDAT